MCSPPARRSASWPIRWPASAATSRTRCDARGPGAAADHWLGQARALRADVVRVDQAVAQAEESARLHPRARRARRAQPRLRTALIGLERCHITLRTIARAVLDRTYFMPESEQFAPYSPEQRAVLADLLSTAATTIASVAPIATDTDPENARQRVDAHLVRLDEQCRQLNILLTVHPQVDQAAWKQHGALLSSIDRLRVEIAAAAREPDEQTVGSGTSVQDRS